MKPVVDYVHSKGLAFGLYTCGGTKTCVGNRPGSKDHWQQDADVFAEWVCICAVLCYDVCAVMCVCVCMSVRVNET